MLAPTPAAAVLQEKLRHSITLTDLQHARVQLRWAYALLAAAMLFCLVEPATLMAGAPESLVHIVADAAAPGASAMARVLALLAALLVPYLLLQFGIGCRRRRGITQLACFALVVAGVLWALLAWRAHALDLGLVPTCVFGVRAGGALLFSLALALTLNAEQLRVLLECPR